jgi:hypothetical protein
MQPDYFNKVMQKELNSEVSSRDKLVNYIDVSWRPNLMSPTSKNYYLGITNHNLILIKVKGNMSGFTDTDENVTLVNVPFHELMSLSIKDKTHTESQQGYYVHYEVKKVTFEVVEKKYKLLIKSGGIHGNNFQLDDIIKTLNQFVACP